MIQQIGLEIYIVEYNPHSHPRNAIQLSPQIPATTPKISKMTILHLKMTNVILQIEILLLRYILLLINNRICNKMSLIKIVCRMF